MAQLAITLGEVAGCTTEPLEGVRGLPTLTLIEVDDGWTLSEAVDGTDPIRAQRFPTPQAAVGYLGNEAEFYNFENPFSFPPFPMEGLEGTPVVIAYGKLSGQPVGGAFAEEGTYSEPTVGQIWPRLA